MTAAWVAAWATVGAAVIYIVLFGVAWLQLSEVKLARRDERRPYVIVDFSFQGFLIYLEVKNIGRTPARNVAITFDKPLTTTLSRPSELDDSPLFNKPTAMLAPGRSIRVLFDSAIARLGREDMPLSYLVSCAYDDSEGHHYDDPAATIDLSTYVGSSLSPKGLPELVAEVESLRKELAKWSNASQGLMVNASNRDKAQARRNRSAWRRIARSTREQEGWPAYAKWLIDRQLRRYGWRS